MADAVWLDVLPSMKGFAAQLAKDSTVAATGAGKKAGKAWQQAVESGGSAGAALVADLEKASRQSAGVVSKMAGVVSQARAAERTATANLVLAEDKLREAREKYGTESAQAQAAELKLEAVRERVTGATLRYESALDQLKAAQRENTEVTGQLEDAQVKLADETGKQPGRWAQFKESVLGGADSADKASGSLKGTVVQLAAAAGGAALFREAWSQNMDLESGVSTVKASLDLTEEQAARSGQVAGDLYAGAWGESMTDVTSAVGTVMSSITGMKDASEEDLTSVTEAALAFAQAFDVDVAESSRNAGILIKTGLAEDAIGAFDLMTASLQQVPEALRGEVVDATQEYSQYFAQLGLDGKQSMGLLVTASADGQYAIDKTGDALKELTIRSTDMSKASVGAYEAAGLSAKDMSNDFLAGGDTANEAFRTLVDGLLSIKDPTEQANAAIGLFGTPLEDLGTDKIPGFLAGLAEMDTGLGDVEGKAGDLGDTLSDNTSTSFETLKRGFMTTLSDGLTPFIEPARQVLEWAKSTPGLIQAVAIALGVMAVAWGVMTIAASPWLAIGALIAVVIAGVVLAVQNWGAITEWFGGIVEGVGSWIAGVWESVAKATSQVWGGIMDFFQAVPGRVSSFFSGLKDRLLAPFVTAKSLALSAWGAVSTWFSQLPGRVGGFLSGVKDRLLSPFVAAKDLALSAWRGVTDWFGDLTKKLRLGNIKDILLAPFKAGFNAIARAWNSTVGKLSWSIPNWVPGIGGNSIGVPNIPYLADGGNILRAGWTVIGEAGPEALWLPQGAQVAPLGGDDGPALGGEKFYISSPADPVAVAMAVSRRQNLRRP